MSEENKKEQNKEEEKDFDVVGANDELEKAVMELIFNEPFYANLTLNMKREFTTSIPTIGVNVTDEVNLFINPYFFESLTLQEQVSVLIHEAHHVINNHFTRFRDLEPQIFENPKERKLRERVQDLQNASVLNQAADYAINEYIPGLPKKLKCFDKDGNVMKYPEKDEQGNKHPQAGKPIEGTPCLVKELKKQMPNIENRQTMEYYYDLLQQENEKQQNQQGEGQGQQADGNGDGKGTMVIDDHSLWHESDADEDSIKEKVKEVVNKAVEQTDERSVGSLPAEVQAAIDALNHVPKDWRQDLQRFVARSQEILVRSTRKKRDRRYGRWSPIYPGKKTYPKLHLAVAIDTSGSVSDEELAQFFSEIKRIHDMGKKVTIIECDADVNNVYEFNPRKKFQVYGRGGTRFAPVFEYIKKNKMEIDGLIYLTDGGCWESELEKPRYPVLWALLKGNECPITWGSRTWVEVKKRVSR